MTESNRRGLDRIQDAIDDLTRRYREMQEKLSALTDITADAVAADAD